jgi:glutathione S-transferase
MLKLYHAEPVANSMKCLLYLQEKGLEYEGHYVDLLRFEQHSDWFKALNPNGQVPVLIHGERIVNESTVINEYLEDEFPENPLRPDDSWERAQMRIWSKFVDEYFCPALSMLGWHAMVRKVAQSLDKDELEKMLEAIPLPEQRQKWATVAGESFTEEQLSDSRRRVTESIRRLERVLDGQPWIAGGSYSLADINSYSMVAGVPRLVPEAMDEKSTPRSLDWLQRMNERPAVQRALAGENRVPETLRTFGD